MSTRAAHGKTAFAMDMVHGIMQDLQAQRAFELWSAWTERRFEQSFRRLQIHSDLLSAWYQNKSSSHQDDRAEWKKRMTKKQKRREKA